ncbi:MAG: isoaspartyl peptidase/L-asparaginase [Salinivirgaceae bacterium]|jgi:beta-aspartyl-peptidase (threonine type)|nr:isoaspartyl peptidase/L-asparaginase [Salinivirgaceae bacterium]
MQLKHVKPYLFILSFFLIPLIFAPLIKSVKNKYFVTETAFIPAAEIKAIPYALAIHGGAGDITPNNFTPEQEAQYKTKLYEALQVGISKLNNGDSAILVVVEVIKILEDSPLFNAGKGAVFSHKGKNEMDASIMNGINENAGAVAGVTIIKNPIEAAFAVMQRSNHVFLSGSGAEEFAKDQGITMVEPKYFYTEKRWESYRNALKKTHESISKYGTVGCVVLDTYGNLAAGTSTGGMTNKKYGRIGDSPIIGAGTYANNMTCAVSATGHGEYFIRYNVAYDISARIKYLNETLKQSSETVIENLKELGGRGGVICIDKNGNINMPFNTQGMYRGYCKSDKEPQIFLY